MATEKPNIDDRLRRHNINKWKIVKKGEEKPLRYMGAKMVFRTKVAMRRLFNEIQNEHPFDQFEWASL